MYLKFTALIREKFDHHPNEGTEKEEVGKKRQWRQQSLILITPKKEIKQQYQKTIIPNPEKIKPTHDLLQELDTIFHLTGMLQRPWERKDQNQAQQ